jgi:hypothetical protein
VLAALLLLPAATAAAVPTWDLSAHPSTSGRTQIFYGAVASGTGDVWAIGYSWGYVGGALEFRTLAQRWNGSSWTTVPTPDVETAPAKDLLFDADGDGPDSIYAAGISATAPGSPSSKPLVLHWNGSTWSIVTLPTAPLGTTLSTITAKAGTVWAAGERYNPLSGYWQPYILRMQNGTWTEVPFSGRDLHPGPAGCKLASDGTLWRWEPGGITIGRDGVPYVAGTCSTTAGDRALLALYKGGHWRTAFDPGTLPAETSRLNDVDAAASGSIRAVGVVGLEPLVLRGAGKNFVREPAPTVGRATSLNSITQGPPRYAVGTVTGSDAWAHPGAFRFANGQWHSEQVTTDFGNPFAVAVEPAGQAWATGVSVTDDFGLILRRNR